MHTKCFTQHRPCFRFDAHCALDDVSRMLIHSGAAWHEGRDDRMHCSTRNHDDIQLPAPLGKRYAKWFDISSNSA